MKQIKISKMKGFTLVELLIVITLIAILSVAVLATINPIEQTNKAKDSSNQNDAAEILNAYERYYANQQHYTWEQFNDIPEITVDSELLLSSTEAGFGICYADVASVGASSPGTCNTTGTNVGLLITSDELKPSFANKTMFRTTANANERMWVVKESGSNGALHVCFIPKSKSARQSANLRCVSSGAGLAVSNIGAGCSAPAANDATAWATPLFNGTSAMFRCVPE